MRRDRASLAALLIAIAAIGSVAIGAARADLRQARTRAAIASAALARPVPRRLPLVAEGAAVASPAAALAVVREGAVRAGLLVETLAPVAAPRPLVRLHLVASGRGAAVLRLAESLEGGRSLLRFESWRIARTPGGAVRLTARLAAVAP